MCDDYAVLDKLQRPCHSGGVLGRRWTFPDVGLQCAAAPLPVSALCAVSLAALWRTDFHVLSVGHVSPRGRLSGAADEFRPSAGHLAAALVAVSLHVHVWRRQAVERRSELVESVGAVVSLFHPAAAHAAGLVCSALADERVEICHRRLVCRLADIAVSDLLPPTAALLCGLWHSCADNLHSHHRQLQLVQSSDHVVVPAVV